MVVLATFLVVTTCLDVSCNLTILKMYESKQTYKNKIHLYITKEEGKKTYIHIYIYI